MKEMSSPPSRRRMDRCRVSASARGTSLGLRDLARWPTSARALGSRPAVRDVEPLERRSDRPASPSAPADRVRSRCSLRRMASERRACRQRAASTRRPRAGCGSGASRSVATPPRAPRVRRAGGVGLTRERELGGTCKRDRAIERVRHDDRLPAPRDRLEVGDRPRARRGVGFKGPARRRLGERSPQRGGRNDSSASHGAQTTRQAPAVAPRPPGPRAVL
jgi:hypothetical protein